MYFRSRRSDAEQPQPGGVCSLCAQDIYIGEEMWRLNGQTVCRDCFPAFARILLQPYTLICGEEEFPHDTL